MCLHDDGVETFRSLDLELPRKLPKLNDRVVKEWQNLLARVMPFDLVIDEESRPPLSAVAIGPGLRSRQRTASVKISLSPSA